MSRAGGMARRYRMGRREFFKLVLGPVETRKTVLWYDYAKGVFIVKEDARVPLSPWTRVQCMYGAAVGGLGGRGTSWARCHACPANVIGE